MARLQREGFGASQLKLLAWKGLTWELWPGSTAFVRGTYAASSLSWS